MNERTGPDVINHSSTGYLTIKSRTKRMKRSRKPEYTVFIDQILEFLANVLSIKGSIAQTDVDLTHELQQASVIGVALLRRFVKLLGRHYCTNPVVFDSLFSVS